METVLAARQGLVVHSVAVCEECGEGFDLRDEEQAAEWYGGHDCEV